MTIQMRTVAVSLLPEISSSKQGRKFLREMQERMSNERPCMVLDCSNVRQLDRSALHLLLCCLEEAMKRNGDIKLAALPRSAEGILARTGVGRLFDIYDTTAEAVNSFHSLPQEIFSNASVDSQVRPWNAA